MDREQSVQHFLDLLKKSRRGNFKIYIGMIAGVGKSYRMLSDAHQLLESGIDVKIGYIETHGRVETEALVEGLPIIPRRKIFYKGKEIEEMDLDSILRLHPELVIIDELAHTNIEGSRNEKRWQDVMELLDAGISIISAVNIQLLFSIQGNILFSHHLIEKTFWRFIEILCKEFIHALSCLIFLDADLSHRLFLFTLIYSE